MFLGNAHSHDRLTGFLGSRCGRLPEGRKAGSESADEKGREAEPERPAPSRGHVARAAMTATEAAVRAAEGRGRPGPRPAPRPGSSSALFSASCCSVSSGEEERHAARPREPERDASVAMAALAGAGQGGASGAGPRRGGRFGAAKFGCGCEWAWAAPRRVAAVAGAVRPGPADVGAGPGEDGALEPGLAGTGGRRPCRR